MSAARPPQDPPRDGVAGPSDYLERPQQADGGPSPAAAFDHPDRARRRADRRAAREARAAAELASERSTGDTAPAWRALLGDRGLQLVLLVTLGLQLFALSRLEGYQLADSVEYMDRAQLVVRGAALDPGTVRSFAFSALLTPYFAVGELLGLEDLQPVVLVVRLGQMLLALIAVAVVTRTGWRLGGRGTGLAAGLLLGASPLLVRWSVSPVSGIAALLAIALGLELQTQRPSPRRGLLAGLGYGVGILMAFKVIPIAALAWLFELLRGGRRRWRPAAAFLVGVLLCIALQAVLDRLVYGSYGSSLKAYVVTNVAPILGRWVYQLGFEQLGTAIFEYCASFLGVAKTVQPHAVDPFRQAQPQLYYFLTLGVAIVPPALALTVLGLGSALRRRGLLGWTLVIQLLLNVLVLSSKGSKSFRLWLPLLPFLAVIGGLGWRALAGELGARIGAPRRVLATLCLIAAPLLGLRVLAGTNLAKFGGYWKAIELVNGAARAREPEAAPLRVASPYQWAVRFRNRADVELVKLPHEMQLWSGLDGTQRAAILAELETLDWFLSHAQVITQDPAIVEVINRRMEIVDVLYDEAHFEDLAPIYVMRARGAAPGPDGSRQAAQADRAPHSFFEVLEDRSPGAYQPTIQHPVSVDFRRITEDGVRQMVFLGWDVEPGPPETGLFWFTAHWYAGPLLGHDYTVLYRWTDGLGHADQLNHSPTWGVHPTSTWQAGWIVRESFARFLPSDPTRFGGDWVRGDLIPAELWMAVAEFDADSRVVGGLNPFLPSGGAPYPRPRTSGELVSGGRRWSADRLFYVGGFWLPVPAAARRPDDGRPIGAGR